MNQVWVTDATFYHLFPLGLCDAPFQNDLVSAPINRLERLHQWLDHIQWLGCNTILLGPVFESSAHGYDTVDFFKVDRRLGQLETLVSLSKAIKQRGMRLVLDGVFNHVGRKFWAFQDVQQHGINSDYKRWFSNLNFEQTSPLSDPFSYEGWAGHYDLVKLNLSEPQVREHLFEAVRFWIDQFDIDGLRLDAADHIDPDFFKLLVQHCRSIKPDFWLMGEIVHGNYAQWANAEMLDSTTNYECYKGLYSSHVDSNYFEIAYAFNRQYGEPGIYKDLLLYNFVDNHDVNRVASNLTKPTHLYPLYGLLFTMPGIPSLYYGSEWGLEGKRTDHSDKALRPALDINTVVTTSPHPHLANAIRQLIAVRHQLAALRHGNYEQLYVSHEQLAFKRQSPNETVIVAVNASDDKVMLTLNHINGQCLRDVLNDNVQYVVSEGVASVDISPNWLRIMIVG